MQHPPRSLRHSFFFVYCLLFLLFSGLANAEPEPGTLSVPIPQGQQPAAAVSQGLSDNARGETPGAPISLLPAPAQAIQPLPVPDEVLLSMQWLADDTGTLTLRDILAPNQQQAFTPYDSANLPHKSGTFWLRLPLSGPFPAEPVLDLNTRMADQLPGIPQVWLAQSDGTGTLLRSTSSGLYPLPSSVSEGTAVYLRINGLPAPGFEPSLISKASVGLVDEMGEAILLAVLAVTLFICLLRGFTERREWRMWAALYIGAIWVQAFWGLPATTAGVVSRWDLPGLLAPGVALLILPHIGRHIMQTRDRAAILDFLFTLLGLAGMLLVAIPLLPDYTWTLRYLPFWPLFTLLLLPVCLIACLLRLPGAKRFFLICLLPSLGVLVPTCMALPETGWLTTGVITLFPAMGLTSSALLAALIRTPKQPPIPNRKKGNRRTETRGHTVPLSLESDEPLSMENDPPSVLAIHGMDEPAQPQHTESALPVNEALLHGKSNHQVLPHLLRTTLTSGQVEGLLRLPLDSLLREISALDQMNLEPEARRRVELLGRASKALTGLIGNMSRTSVQPEKAVAPKLIETFDLNQLLLEVHNAVEAQAEAKNLGLTWFTAPHLPRYYDGQRIQLAEVLEMLTESAILATDRGMVQIRAQRVPESTDPGHILFTISDTGSGTPPFSRSSLAFVRAWELAAAGGNCVSLNSTPEGTTVSFSMHLTARSAEIPLTHPETTDKELVSRLPASSLRILVVSGVPANRQLLAYYLNELPHEILEARSPEEAQQLYCNAPGALIIFDDDMPEEAIAKAVASIRIFEGEYNFPLASILALVSSDEQREQLRRAGCTHTLMKPVVRKDLRHLTLRLAPVPRRYNDTAPVEDKPAEATCEPKTDMPVTTIPEPMSLPEKENIPHKRQGFLSRLFGRKKPSENSSEQRASSQMELPLPEKGKLSSVGEPMPISRLANPKTEETADETPSASPTEQTSKRHSPEPHETPKQPAHRPSRRHQPAPAVWTSSENRLSTSSEWVGEPMPITKKTTESEAAPTSDHTETPSVPVSEPVEWVGEPMPISPKTDSRQAKGPLTLSPLDIARSHKNTTREQSFPSEAPIDLVEWVGEPMPIPPKQEEPLQMAPTAQAELKLVETGLVDTPDMTEGKHPLSRSVGQKQSPRTPHASRGASLPDLFGSDQDSNQSKANLTETILELDTPAVMLEAEKSVAELSVSPLDLHTETAVRPETGNLSPTEEFLSEKASQSCDDTAQEQRTEGVHEDTQGEDSDAAIQCLLKELDVALEQVIFGQKRNDASEVRKAASRIAKLAETFDLRVLDDPARCIEMAAQGGDMEEVQQLVPDLAAAIARNRAAFEEKAD